MPEVKLFQMLKKSDFTEQLDRFLSKSRYDDGKMFDAFEGDGDPIRIAELMIGAQYFPDWQKSAVRLFHINIIGIFGYNNCTVEKYLMTASRCSAKANFDRRSVFFTSLNTWTKLIPFVFEN